jgi:type VII secretion protein EccE
VGPAQVVACELAAMAVAVAWYALPAHLAMPIAVAAVALMLPIVGRYRGRWWYEAVSAWLVLRRRRNATAGSTSRTQHPQWTEFAGLAPGGLVIRTVQARATSFGVGEDGGGWFAAVAVRQPDDLAGPGELRLEWLARLVGPLSTVTVVTRQAPPEFAGAGTPSAQSYQELCAALSVEPTREVWIGVRLTLRDAASVDPDGTDELASIHRVLGGALIRISDALASHGLAHRVLDGDGLAHALLDAYVADPGEPGSSARERWSRWRSGRLVHVCFGVTGWPSRVPRTALADLTRVPGAVAVNTAVAMGAVRSPDDVDGPLALRLLVRVVATPATVGACVRHLRGSARRLGLSLARLDGEQGPAVYATTPTASADGWHGPW